MTILFLFIAAYGNGARACKCNTDRPFMDIAPSCDLIVLAEVIKYRKVDGLEQAMDVRVLSVLSGKESHKTIRVWGDDGTSCRPYVAQFPLRSTWILALQPHESDYRISVCGEYWLKVEENRVYGRIETLQEESWPMDRLKERLAREVNP
jgi:hypothetical protein